MIRQNAQKLVSIIVPVYNCESYIEKCLQSIMNQSYKQIEILVVNDGSTDKSQEIINYLVQVDSRIHKMSQINKGVSEARNYALKYARGDYYLFVDGDDYIGRDYVKDLVECACKTQSELVISGYTLVYAKTNKTLSIIPGLYRKYEKEEWAYRISSVGGRLYDSKFWNRNDLHFITEKGARGEDVPIALFANAMAKNIQIINKANYFYVQREGSAMNSKKKVIFLFPYIAFEEMYNKLKSIEITNSRMFLDMGIIKLLAMFKYVIYFRADRNEKNKFKEYVCNLLRNDFSRMKSEWKTLKMKIDLPLTHKIAVSLFLIQMEFGRGGHNVY